MRLSTLLTAARTGQLRTARAALALMTPFYRTTWLSTAGEEGVLRLLAEGPRPLEAIAASLEVPATALVALASWLQVGVVLGDLDHGPEGYALSSLLARRLARAEHDPVLAMLAEIADLHFRLIQQSPARLREGRPFTLADQSGALIARSSRIVEPFIHEAVARAVPSGPSTLLEIGCGHGTHVRHAAACNPELTGLGLELQAEVAEAARENLERWGLADRFAVEVGDVRDRTPEPAWDLVTLHQNIYYFPFDERVALLRHVAGFLRPGGRLLLTTACRGPSAMVTLLDLWGAATEGAGRLPEPAEMVSQLEDAGLTEVVSRRLVPGEPVFSFVGYPGAREAG